MEILRIPFSNIPQLSQKDVAYAEKASALKPFIKYEVALESFKEVMNDRSKVSINREVLVDALREQYASLSSNDYSKAQIERLADQNTYTVTTAHQPSLFTGPLYFIHKICSTINLARQLNEAYPGKQFIPVFVTGGEDHDFEEINHLHLFGKTFQWNTSSGGPVGKISTESLSPVLTELEEMLGQSENAQEIFRLIKENYTRHQHYGMATLSFVHELFGDEGLVVLDMNKAALKHCFKAIMKEELLYNVSRPLIEKSQKALEDAGFSGQAHAREINLFYLRDDLRERIEKQDEHFAVLNTDLRFTEAEILKELDQHPERFSPNVVMRPLFQELILPNLAYIGGGGELAYWMERKEQFQHFGLNFPMLIRRNSVMWMDKGTVKKMNKLQLKPEQLFEDTDALIRKFVKEQSDSSLSLEKEKADFNTVFEHIAEKAKAVDPTLAKAILAEQSRQFKSIENLEGRLLRAEKQKHETAINQIRGLKDKLYPANGLQERYDNFLSLYLSYGSSFLAVLIEELSPLEAGFVVVVDK